MKNIKLLGLLGLFLIAGCNENSEDCKKNPELSCYACDALCAKGYVCMFKDLDNQVEQCVLGTDLVCENDSSCPTGTVCSSDKLCEEVDCLGICGPNEICVQFPDNNELLCLNE